MLKEECSNLEDVRGHPHLLDFEQTLQDDKAVHIISELLEGAELYDAIIELKKQRTYFTEEDSAWMVHNILDGLSYCHDVIGIVHRDLKASNFMFKRKVDIPRRVKHDKANKTRNHRNLRDIKIIDFGMSTKIDPNTGKVKGCMGTSYYVAPEVLTEDSYNSKCDVWSIGVITYLILSRQLPYQGKDEQETVRFLENAENHKPKYDSMRWRTLDPQAVAFCKSLLQVDPAKRPTAREAMCHPWIVKHCGQPPPQRRRINLEHSIVLDKTAPLPLLMRDSLTFKSSCSWDSQRSFSTQEDDLRLTPHSHVHMDSIPERQSQEQNHNGSSKNNHKNNLMKLWCYPSKDHRQEEEAIHFNSNMEGTPPRTRQRY